MAESRRPVGTLRAIGYLFFLLAGFSLLWLGAASFVLRNRFVEWTHAREYRPAFFRVEKVFFFPPSPLSGGGTSPAWWYAEGKIDEQHEERFDMHGYVSGVPTSQADAERRVPAGSVWRVLYNPRLSRWINQSETLRVVKYDERFLERQRAGFFRWLLYACGPAALFLVLGLGLLAAARSGRPKDDLKVEDGEQPTVHSAVPRARVSVWRGDLPPWVTGITVGVMFVGLGVFVVLIGTGVISFPDSSSRSPRWVVTAMGLAFLLAGLMTALGYGSGWTPASAGTPAPPPTRGFLFMQLLLGVPLLVCFAAPFNWIAFGPGERSGTMSIGGLGFLLPVKAGSAASRVVWAIPALGLDVFAVAYAVKVVKQLRDLSRP